MRVGLKMLVCGLIIVLLSGCGETYVFQGGLDEVSSVEIVYAESSSAYFVQKRISESEIDEFFKAFETLRFHTYLIGDPMSVSGDAVKITYADGEYEIICDYWAEYVKDQTSYSIRKSCDRAQFSALLDKYLPE